jgi:hypothetical protein
MNRGKYPELRPSLRNVDQDGPCDCDGPDQNQYPISIFDDDGGVCQQCQAGTHTVRRKLDMDNIDLYLGPRVLSSPPQRMNSKPPRVKYSSPEKPYRQMIADTAPQLKYLSPEKPCDRNEQGGYGLHKSKYIYKRKEHAYDEIPSRDMSSSIVSDTDDDICMCNYGMGVETGQYNDRLRRYNRILHGWYDNTDQETATEAFAPRGIQ